MSHDEQPKIAVSYARVAEGDGSSAGEVDRFCEYFRKLGVEVLRDSDSLKPGGDIEEFMKRVAASKVVAIFLSDAYLKSESCLFELQTAWDRCGGRTEEKRARLKVYVMQDAGEILRDGGKRRYIRHWQNAHRRLLPTIKTEVGLSATGKDVARLNRIEGFPTKLREILDDMRGSLRATDLEGFLDEIREAVGVAPPRVASSAGRRRRAPASVRGKAKKARKRDAARRANVEMQNVYRTAIDDMEQLLRVDSLARFLRATSPGLLFDAPTGPRLSDAVRERKFDASEFLKPIKSNLSRLDLGGPDGASLLQFLGGLMVLAIDSMWVLRQRKKIARDVIRVPTSRERVVTQGGRQANFLYLICSALAGGMARLERVFGELEVDERRMRSPPEVGLSVLETDQLTEWKRYFVRLVMPSVPLEKRSSHQLDLDFEDARNHLKFALQEKRQPFYATDKDLVARLEKVRRYLEIEDVLLITPTGEHSRDRVFTNSIFALNHLSEIFDAIDNAQSGKPRRNQPA